MKFIQRRGLSQAYSRLSKQAGAFPVHSTFRTCYLSAGSWFALQVILCRSATLSRPAMVSRLAWSATSSQRWLELGNQEWWEWHMAHNQAWWLCQPDQWLQQQLCSQDLQWVICSSQSHLWECRHQQATHRPLLVHLCRPGPVYGSETLWNRPSAGCLTDKKFDSSCNLNDTCELVFQLIVMSVAVSGVDCYGTHLSFQL